MEGNPLPPNAKFLLEDKEDSDFVVNRQLVQIFLQYSPKMVACLMLIMDQTFLAGEKSILWFAYPLIQSLAHEILGMLGIEHLELTAKIKPADRQKVVDQFNDHNDPKMHLLASIEVGGTGINLQKDCRNCIIVDSCKSYAQFMQVRGRTYRFGLTDTARIFTLVVPRTADATTIAYVCLRGLAKGFPAPPYILTLLTLNTEPSSKEQLRAILPYAITDTPKTSKSRIMWLELTL